MSHVTNLILTTVPYDRGIHELNRSLSEAHPTEDTHTPWKFVNCDDDESVRPRGWYAGDKYLECDIYPAAFNCLDLQNLIDTILAVEWDEPASVQLFVQDENQHRFTEVELFPHRAKEFCLNDQS